MWQAIPKMIGLQRELLEPLDGVERLGFCLGDLFAGRLKPAAAAWNSSFTAAVAWLCLGRRLNLIGLENIVDLNRDSRVLLVANHRSFFDFFAISAATMWGGRMPTKRTFYPVRASFFYESPLGIGLNAAMSGMSMFPPIFKERSKYSFNRYALDRCVLELERPGTVVGVHPEGTRNKSSDPYTLLPAKTGMGRIALGVDDGVEIIPVFVMGMSNDLNEELKRNWRDSRRYPVNVIVGPRVDLFDLRRSSRAATEQTLHGQAAKRCVEAIERLGEIERDLRSSQLATD